MYCKTYIAILLTNVYNKRRVAYVLQQYAISYTKRQNPNSLCESGFLSEVWCQRESNQ